MQDPSYPQTDHIVGVWDRQMLDAKMARAPAVHAEIFAVLIRVTDRFAAHLMPSSGVDGIYFECRTMDGRKPDPQFRVIWMPKKNLAQVRLARSQTEPRTTIGRMGPRFGLRADKDHAEQVHLQPAAQTRSDVLGFQGF